MHLNQCWIIISIDSSLSMRELIRISTIISSISVSFLCLLRSFMGRRMRMGCRSSVKDYFYIG